MCGIAGICGADQTLKNNIHSMLAEMKHRGPDDRDVYENDRFIFGHNRLSIIDLSSAGKQPMHSACGRYTIILNGEVYNYRDLRKDVPSSINLRSETDTEIVLELWAKEQHTCIRKLRGMFAFAIWDHQSGTLDLVRDHMGIKPLYYYQGITGFAFASEIKGLIKSGLFKPSVSLPALEQYLRIGYVMQPDTMLNNVFMLPPASYLTLKDDQLTIKKYWEVQDKAIHSVKTEEEAISFTRKLVTDAINEETVSDRPLGVFLSGGLDSNIVVAALRAGGVKHIKTFSVGFDNNELSEENEALAAANFYGTQHMQVQVSDKDVTPHIDEYIRALDVPSVDGLNTWLVSKFTAPHVTVALSGLGGDELFSGYGIDRKIIYKYRYTPLFKLLHYSKPLIALFPEKISKRLYTYASWHKLDEWYGQWGSIFKTDTIGKLTGNRIQEQHIFAKTDPGTKYSLLQRLSLMHMRGFMMSRLLRDSDAVSMSHSLEVRFPLIDHLLVNFVWHLPQDWKIKHIKDTALLKHYEENSSYEHHGLKHLLYQAFKPLLPPEFGTRPKKGFKIPIDKWMQTSLEHDIKNTLLQQHTFLNKNELENVWRQWNQKQISWTQVWSVYIFEKWYRQNIG